MTIKNARYWAMTSEKAKYMQPLLSNGCINKHVSTVTIELPQRGTVSYVARAEVL
jgi:hypothetical protein